MMNRYSTHVLLHSRTLVLFASLLLLTGSACLPRSVLDSIWGFMYIDGEIVQKVDLDREQATGSARLRINVDPHEADKRVNDPPFWLTDGVVTLDDLPMVPDTLAGEEGWWSIDTLAVTYFSKGWQNLFIDPQTTITDLYRFTWWDIAVLPPDTVRPGDELDMGGSCDSLLVMRADSTRIWFVERNPDARYPDPRYTVGTFEAGTPLIFRWWIDQKYLTQYDSDHGNLGIHYRFELTQRVIVGAPE